MVLVSGGGRCNVTHACFDNKKLVQYYPRGGKKLLDIFFHFNSESTVNWFKKYGVELKAEPDGRMFPITDSSSTIINCFNELAEDKNVDVLLKHEVISITNQEDSFMLETKEGVIHTTYLIVTTGGSAKIESYKFIESLGITINKPIPSLFTFLFLLDYNNVSKKIIVYTLN